MKTRTLAVLSLALAGTSMLAACNTHGGPLADASRRAARTKRRPNPCRRRPPRRLCPPHA